MLASTIPSLRLYRNFKRETRPYRADTVRGALRNGQRYNPLRWQKNRIMGLDTLGTFQARRESERVLGAPLFVSHPQMSVLGQERTLASPAAVFRFPPLSRRPWHRRLTSANSQWRRLPPPMLYDRK